MKIAAGIGIETESYWTEGPKLRFVKRPRMGRILQYAQVRRYESREEVVWVDVPLAPEEEMEDE